MLHVAVGGNGCQRQPLQQPAENARATGKGTHHGIHDGAQALPQQEDGGAHAKVQRQRWQGRPQRAAIQRQVGGCLRCGGVHGGCSLLHHVLRRRREQPRDQACARQQQRRGGQRQPAFVRMLGLRLGAALLPEDAQRNRCGHGNADGGKQGVGPTACGQIGRIGFGLHERFLGDKAKGAGQARHRQAAEQRGGGGKRHGLAQERQRADVARAGAVIDIACDKEQGGLVHGVRQQQGRNGKRCLVAGHAHDEYQRAQRGHGGPGQNPLQVKFAQSQQHAPGGGEGACHLQAGLPPEPGVHACIQPRQQVHAQLDHGGRVQVGRSGRGSRHGIG